jgi:hypothetical protein
MLIDGIRNWKKAMTARKAIMDCGMYRASTGDAQAVEALWDKNKGTLIARVCNPFGFLSENEVECIAVSILLKKIEHFGARIQRRKGYDLHGR